VEAYIIEKLKEEKMKILVMSVCLLLFCNSCGSHSGKYLESVKLKDIEIIPGKHCESSAILNALHYLDYDVSEEMIVGGGGALSFIYEKKPFPFLGGRSYDMKETFFENADIKWHLVEPKNDEEAWTGIVKLLKEEIPVVLRVDLRYLPYRFAGRYGPRHVSFGWHYITLFGIDTKENIAHVSDTEFEGLQKIRIKDLEKARSSKTKIFPPEREYFWIEKKPVNYKTDWDKLAYSSIKKVVSNMESQKEDFGLKGLSELGSNIVGIEDYIGNKYMLSPAFEVMHGWIEEFGSGGAAFRILYSDFLKLAARKIGDEKIGESIKYIEESIEVWHKLADDFMTASKEIKYKKGKEERIGIYENIAKTADDLYNKEKVFIGVLRTIIK
jgi:hypothetical protein